MSTFQIVIITIFGASIFIGVMIFALRPRSQDPSEIDYGMVNVWGTLPASVVENATHDLGVKMQVRYTQKSESSLLPDMKDELSAPGENTPDVVIFPPGEFVNYRRYLFALPETFMNERTLRSTYTEQAGLYVGEKGIYALPLVVDPMVMYWNRDTFASNAVSQPPLIWDEFKTLAPKMTVLENGVTIKKSAIPFGEYVNVTHAKDIISMLIMQSGAPIISSTKGVLKVEVNTPIDTVLPGVTAFEFYTEFSNRLLPTYSWNRSLPSSKEMFVAGDSAVYFGYASEIPEIQKTNPHLNFDIAMMPQKRTTGNKLTYGRMIGAGALEISRNKQGALKVMELLSGSGTAQNTMYLQKLSEGLNLPPAHRILLAKKPSDPFLSLFYDAAQISKSWPDPSPTDTDRVFETALESVLSNKFSIDIAISSLERQLEQVVSDFTKKTNKK